MDAFEPIVAQVLDVGGYWTRIGVKESEIGVKSKGRVAQIGSFEKKIVQKVAMVC